MKGWMTSFESVVEAGMLPVQIREKMTIDLRWTPLYTCVQDWFSVASVIEHALSLVNMENPQVTKI